jgi:crotonobetainyl-CoA:carnitine CoA-transferase CaiB-like acyl-CoA transferase
MEVPLNNSEGKPLAAIRVLDLTHAVMGPCASLMLADMGADVVHVEPPEGDPTRSLKGFGMGYFPFYNRNKRSLAVDLKTADGLAVVHALAKRCDVFIENFGPNTADRLGLSYATLRELNPRIIYCSLKGFLSGPYENRHAMDEVVQMMGGLAYMTGPRNQPLRAGTSVVDITGGMFGSMGILAALFEREKSGKGKLIRSSLFETTAFLMGQHMAYSAQSETPIPPMPERQSAWSVYQIFTAKDDLPVFIGIISDRHWQRFCEAFAQTQWATDSRLATNNGRIAEKDWFLPAVTALMAQFDRAEIATRCERFNIPFAPVARPEDLFTDPQLNQSGRLLPVEFNGKQTMLPALPIEWDGQMPELSRHPPLIGQHTNEILSELGFSHSEIERLRTTNSVACASAAQQTSAEMQGRQPQ